MITKIFPTLLVGSAATDRALVTSVSISELAELMSHVLGYAIWTHEVFDAELLAKVEAALSSQFPKFLSADHRPQAAIDAAIAAYGETVSVVGGYGTRTESPIASAERIMGGDTGIIVVAVEEKP